MTEGRFITSLLTVFGLAVTPEQCPTIKPQSYPPQCQDFRTRAFDFIIVGSGPGGCALANRLCEVPEWSVLMIEAGDYPTAASEVPAGTLYLLDSPETTTILSQPLPYASAFVGNRIPVPQGRALGGSSTINGLLDAPGQPYDYNHWAELANSSLWGWSVVKFYFDKVRDKLPATYLKVATDGRLRLEAAAKELGVDVNGATPFGFKDEALDTVNGVRLSMAKAYLQPLHARSNFCLVVDTVVNKVLIDPGTKAAVGVEVQQVEIDNSSVTRERNATIAVAARGEVILAAGAISTPKILMLSGIGPKDHLRTMQIPVIEDLPVGRHLQDHYHVPLFNALDDLDMVPFNDLLALYCQTGDALNAVGITTFASYFHDSSATPPSNASAASQWYTTPRSIEILVTQVFRKSGAVFEKYLRSTNFRRTYKQRLRAYNAQLGFLMPLITLLHPKSRGRVSLRSADPKAPPNIDLNYFDHPADLETVRRGISSYVQLKNTAGLRNTTWLDMKVAPCDRFDFMSEEYVKCYAMMFATTTFHYAGTCRMGAARENSVVDARLRVHGMHNLRVCDSSVIPELISGHPSVPTAMIGERLADIIKESHHQAAAYSKIDDTN